MFPRFRYPAAVTGDGERIVRWSENPHVPEGIHFGPAEPRVHAQAHTPEEDGDKQNRPFESLPSFTPAEFIEAVEAGEIANDPEDEEDCPGCQVCDGKTYPPAPEALPLEELTWERMVSLQPELRYCEELVRQHVEDNIPYMAAVAEKDGIPPEEYILHTNWKLRGTLARFVENFCAEVPELCSDHARTFAENHLTAGVPVWPEAWRRK